MWMSCRWCWDREVPCQEGQVRCLPVPFHGCGRHVQLLVMLQLAGCTQEAHSTLNAPALLPAPATCRRQPSLCSRPRQHGGWAGCALQGLHSRVHGSRQHSSKQASPAGVPPGALSRRVQAQLKWALTTAFQCLSWPCQVCRQARHDGGRGFAAGELQGLHAPHA